LYFRTTQRPPDRTRRSLVHRRAGHARDHVSYCLFTHSQTRKSTRACDDALKLNGNGGLDLEHGDRPVARRRAGPRACGPDLNHPADLALHGFSLFVPPPLGRGCVDAADSEPTRTQQARGTRPRPGQCAPLLTACFVTGLLLLAGQPRPPAPGQHEVVRRNRELPVVIESSWRSATTSCLGCPAVLRWTETRSNPASKLGKTCRRARAWIGGSFDGVGWGLIKRCLDCIVKLLFSSTIYTHANCLGTYIQSLLVLIPPSYFNAAKPYHYTYKIHRHALFGRRRQTHTPNTAKAILCCWCNQWM
jgi:hypothetical protein